MHDTLPVFSNFGGSKHTDMTDNRAIFPLFYLPPIAWFSRLIQSGGDAVVEKHEHFPKQTYRNRASISSPNGKLDLIIPVIRGSGVHTAMKDVKISYDFNWQRQHWMSLQTSYRSSSWFEFYEDDLAPFYEKRTEFLFAFNEELIQLLTRLLKIKISYGYTLEYNGSAGTDFRQSMHPKKSHDDQLKPYFQLFEDRHGFMPNLSVIDLLFSQGPRSAEFL